MNVTQHHPKVKVTLAIPNSVFVSGDEIRGKFMIESRTENALGLATISVELLATQELTSRDHAATSTFLHTRRVFQGAGLPISNAVLYESPAHSTELPRHYHPARKGQTSFFFAFPLPVISPSSTNFGNGLGKVKYEVIAQVEVFWRGERRVVTDQKNVDVAECLPQLRELPPVVVLGEGGRLHIRARIIGMFVVLGQTGCVELFIQNHSNRKTNGVTISLTRKLKLARPPSQEHPFVVTDSLATIPFNGPEYCVPPGGEGVAHLVFDVPKNAISSMGGLRETDQDRDRESAQRRRAIEKLIFGVECEVVVTVGMGLGAKDVVFTLPVVTTHPQTISPAEFQPPPPPPPIFPNGQQAYIPPYAADAYPPLEPPRMPFAREQHSAPPSPQFRPYPPTSDSPYLPQLQHVQSPPTHYFPQYSSQPTTPIQGSFNLAPTPPIHPRTPQALPQPPIHQMQNQPPPQWGGQWTPPVQLDNGAAVWFPPPPLVPPVPPRPPVAVTQPEPLMMANAPPRVPTPPANVQHSAAQAESPSKREVDGVEGKGARAEKVSKHLRYTSRTRSVSPTSHRFPVPPAPAAGGSPRKPVPAPIQVPAHTAPEASARLAGAMSSSVGSLEVPLPSSSDQVPTGLTQQPGVLSPRPKLSPRMSYDESVTASGRKAVSLKSKPVEELERMAEQILKVEAKEQVEATEPGKAVRLDKTLPTPPPPPASGRDRVKTRPAALPTAGEIFGLGLSGAPQQTTGSVLERREDAALHASTSAANGSGLDALEKRLAGQKMDAAERWLARGRLTESEPQVPDSPTRPRPVRQITGPRPEPTSSDRSRSQSRERNKVPKESGLPAMPMPRAVEPKVDPHEQEIMRLQKEAVKRVNKWMEEVPDREEPAMVPWATLSGQAFIPKTSSGFMSTRKPLPPMQTSVTGLFEDDAATASSPWSGAHSQPSPHLPSSPTLPSSPDAMSPLKAAATVAMSPMLGMKRVPHSFALQPPPATKYDIRSARGGKGGVVTSVTSIWENSVQAASNTTTTEAPAITPQPNLPKAPMFKIPSLPASASQPVISKPTLLAGPIKPTTKETSPQRITLPSSDPAAVNGTIARPYISSATSLVRGPQRGRTSMDAKMPPIVESVSAPQLRSLSTEPSPSPSPPKPIPVNGGVGQTKLKELIAKYQNAAKT